MSALDDVVDRVAILDLYSRYCFAIDASDAAAFGSCFLPDGVFDVVDRGRFAGREAIENMISSSAEGRPRHMYMNPWIKQIDGDSATATAYFLVLNPANGENMGYGHYEDDLVRDTDGAWRWRTRQVVFEWTSAAYAGRGTNPDDDA
jgi:uncharacterized protein (TIGR02246 family)